MKSRMWVWVLIVACIAFVLGIVAWQFRDTKAPFILSPLSGNPIQEKTLDRYSIEQLAARTYAASPIIFQDPIATTSSYSVIPFFFMSDGKKVTGLAHLPAGKQVSQFEKNSGHKFPVIVQFRGFVDPAIYTQGMGTKHSAERFAQYGFVSLAPDFLNYGGSDTGSTDVFEDRFQTYTTALNLLVSIPTISFVDAENVFLWGHSNGGQIALSVLSILGTKGESYPTTLWAPVTAVFPYSILYFTDEFDDFGKALRKELAIFEQTYDVDRYAFYHYLDRIQAPLQLHQGTADEAVPVKWSDAFVKRLKSTKGGTSIRYYTYPGNDHNFSQSWDTVMNRDLEFYQSFLP